MSFQQQFKCVLPNGIHARPASLLESVCNPYCCDISLHNLRNGNVGNAKSMLSLVSTDTLLNDEFVLMFEGEDSQTAMLALTQFMNERFPYCDDEIAPLEAQREIPIPQSLSRHKPFLLHGKSLVNGIVKGKLVASSEADLSLFLAHSSVDAGPSFQQVHGAVVAELEAEKLQASGKESEILSAHLSILKDREFLAYIEEQLAHQSIAHAILAALESFKAMLERSNSQYLRERVLDIKDVALRLLVSAYPNVNIEQQSQLSEATILLARELTPSQFLALDKRYLKGLVLSDAGSTSHTVILARAFDIPTLVNVDYELCHAELNSDVYLDCLLGVIAIKADENVSVYFERALKLQQQQKQRFSEHTDKLAITSDGHELEIAANIACSIEVAPAIKGGAQGVGLFRTEMLFMDRSEAPSEECQYQEYREALIAAQGKPVIIRTMDIGGDKPLDYLNLPKETNPFLGYRAVRIYPQFLELFHSQLRAILRAACHGAAKIMIPMVHNVEEIRWVKQQISLVEKQLEEAGLEYNNSVPLGIMVEVPATVFIIDKLAHEVEFFSIGSNDMTQYLLAVDRDNDAVSSLYNSLSPAFLRMLGQITSVAKQYGRWVGMCGELAADPKILPLLVGAGLDELSMSSPNIAKTKQQVAGLSFLECEALYQQACECSTRAEIEMLLNEAISKRSALPLLDESCVFTQLEVKNKEEAIQALVGNIGVFGRCQNALLLEEDIWAREEIFSTGLGNGFAIPHTKSDNIEHSTISIAHLNNAINWHSDSGNVDFIIMLTLNKAHSDQHMQIFSKLARKLIHEDFRGQLKAATEPSEIITILQNELFSS
jgi:fructose-specific PTS system IIA-like component